MADGIDQIQAAIRSGAALGRGLPLRRVAAAVAHVLRDDDHPFTRMVEEFADFAATAGFGRNALVPRRVTGRLSQMWPVQLLLALAVDSGQVEAVQSRMTSLVKFPNEMRTAKGHLDAGARAWQ